MKYVWKKSLTGKIFAFIDISPELTMKDYGGESTFSFQITTYGNLNKTNVKEEAWHNACYPPNEFFKTFTVEDCRLFIEAIVDIKLNIMTFFSEIDNGIVSINKLPEFTTVLSNRLMQLDDDMNLCKRIRQFVDDKHIQTGVDDNIGNRPQDTKKMTFTSNDIKELIAIIILCKILFPVTGEIVARLKPNNLGKHQDPHCKAITNGLVEKHWKPLYLKLDNYIKMFVSKETNSAHLHQVYNGMNEMSLCIFIVSNLFVRNFINFNLFDPSAKSVMSYVYSIITHVIKTQASQCYSNRVIEREPLASSDEDPGNVADLEVHSISTKLPYDTLAIIDAGIQDVANKAMLMYSIDSDEVDEAYNFYLTHPLEPNVLTTSLLCGFYKTWMSGKNIKYINSAKYMYLVAILQNILIKQNKFELAIMLTTITTGKINPINGLEMQKLRVFNPNYNAIEQRFDFVHGSNFVKLWKEHVTDIIETLTTKEFLMNMYYKIYEELGIDNINSSRILITNKIMSQFYEFIAELL